MQTKQTYYQNQYKKEISTKILSISTEGNTTKVILEQTIFYPEGGGQPSDQGVIKGKKGELEVQQVLIKDGEIVHLGKLTGELKENENVDCTIDWDRRYKNMRVHTGGHIIHDSVMQLFPELTPVEGEHGKKAYLKYDGNIDEISANLILDRANKIVNDKLEIKTEFVTLDELQKRSSWVPEHLPKNKPLRIMQIGNFSVIPDGGTQLKNTLEVGKFSQIQIINEGKTVYVYYKIEISTKDELKSESNNNSHIIVNTDEFINLKNQSIAQISMAGSVQELEEIRIDLFGKNGKLTTLFKSIKNVSPEERKQIGQTINEVKSAIEDVMIERKNSFKEQTRVWFDPTLPPKEPNLGHLHFITKGIDEITEVFQKIGFQRVRYPEVEWDYFAFSALNFPQNHPARDDWETFFVDAKDSEKFGPMLLTPHTSSGQIREMLSNKPPIRMINIAKTYRRQLDTKHYPMFHQFEGLVVDKGISIVHLKGTLDYFAKTFFGPDRVTRIRPYHFQFTEPSFEVDVSCNVCNGKGCKLCKEGWLEIGGAGMVHPNVLKECGVDTKTYSGFAFGWGVERTYMMKSGLSVPDIRLLYSSDIRILKQL